MNCKEIQYLISDSQHDEIDQANRSLVEKHLKNCQGCNKVQAEFNHLMNVIGQVEEELPDEKLELNFSHMLAVEKANYETSNMLLNPQGKFLKSILQVAAAILLMISCYLIGSHRDNESIANEIAALIQEKTEMQTITTMSLMENESASKRLQAVSYAKSFTDPDYEILTALISRMENDKHTNVRLAAANALAKFADNAYVRQALITALEKEENANMQIELIQILVHIEEKRAIPTMRKLLQNSQTPNYIRDQINTELNHII